MNPKKAMQQETRSLENINSANNTLPAKTKLRKFKKMSVLNYSTLFTSFEKEHVNNSTDCSGNGSMKPTSYKRLDEIESSFNSIECDDAENIRTTPNAVSFTIPYPKKKRNSYAKNDLSRISIWYQKIDEKFKIACENIELYFDYCYNNKIMDICRHLKDLSSLSCFDYNISYDSINRNSNISIEKSNAVTGEEFFNKFKTSMEKFTHLSNEIEWSNYGKALNIYYATKRFELSEFVTQLKIQQMKDCQQRVSTYILEQLCMLNNRLCKPIETDEIY